MLKYHSYWCHAQVIEILFWYYINYKNKSLTNYNQTNTKNETSF